MADQEQILEYRVRVKTFGDPEKLPDKAGRRLAKICWLNFSEVEVLDDNGKRYHWPPPLHDGGLNGDLDLDNSVDHH